MTLISGGMIFFNHFVPYWSISSLEIDGTTVKLHFMNGDHIEATANGDEDEVLDTFKELVVDLSDRLEELYDS